MPHKLLSSVYFLIFFLVIAYPSVAQTPPNSVTLSCGTENLTRPQALSLSQMASFALQLKRASGAAFSAITYVPIRPHILRRSDGSGGFNLNSLNNVIALTNSYYLLNGFGIQFYFAGATPDYIDNDVHYNNFSDEYAVTQGHDATNALNQYYVNQFATLGLGGYAYYPSDGVYSTRSFILTGSGEYEEDLGNRLIPHELGHNFNLIHTFGQNAGNGTLGSGTTTELANGANCTTDGDLVCDTPADPYNMAGAYLTYVNGCPQYDPNSTARDPNGMSYNPSITNIMSYYFPCTHNFTPGQYDRMQAGLALRQSHTSYTLDAPPTNVAAPTNLTGTQSGLNVILTWQDNANNEMGYFIERSTSPSSGFVPIGGVGPNGTTFTDTKTLYQPLYYRIRPSNTTTGSLSSTFAFQVKPPLVTGLYTSNLTDNSATLNWNSVGGNATYDIQWRVAGTQNWNTYTGFSGTNYTLYSLTSNTSYEWQIKVSTGAVYASSVGFITTCSAPSYFGNYPNRVSASLYWSNSNGQTYVLQWRPKGTQDWANTPTLTTSFYSLTGLTSSTAYEWRAQATCLNPPTVTTGFSSIQSFTTTFCQLPSSISATNIFSTSTQIYWADFNNEPSKTYEISYRPVGTPAWTTVTSLTNTYGSYTLTGLTNNTTYEYRLRAICSPTESSDYSPTNTFTTTCRLPTYLSTTVAATVAKLYWQTNGYSELGATFDLQYRPTGSASWTTISGIQSGFYSLTGLATNVSYEWHVRNVCTSTERSDYSAINTFTTNCNAPQNYNLYTAYVQSSSVQLNWYGLISDPAVTFDLRYRPVGTNNWTTISNLTTDSYGYGFYNLSGLTVNVQYEWQIRSVCTGMESSTYTSGPTFTTQCITPFLYTQTSGITSQTLAWNQTGNSITYEFRYRKYGTSNWITTSTQSTTIALSNLTSNTQYESQVRALCSDGVTSNFSSSYSFYTALCSTPYSLYTTNIKPTSARINFYFSTSDPAVKYEVRYRAVGTSDWISSPIIPYTAYYNYLDLTKLASNTQYEWQLRTICSSTESSDFSSSVTFQTLMPCSTVYTIRSGYWSDPSIWSCNYVPEITDVVQIKHQVIIPSGFVATAQQVGFDSGQTVQYQSGAQLKIGL